MIFSLLSKILFIILFIGGTAYAQSVTTDTLSGNQQVSPVYSLSQENTPVVNNNMQILQNGINATFYEIQSYFPDGVLPTYSGGTGANLLDIPIGDTIVMQSNGVFAGAYPGGVPHNIQIFTSSGTWTQPLGVTQVYVKVVGGGGNGSPQSGGSTSGGAGGGGGGYAEGVIAVSGNVNVTIGSTNSFAGNTTIQATSGSGQTPGTGSGGVINLSGQPGHPVYTFAIAVGQTPNGGNSMMGSGGQGSFSLSANCSNGSNGNAYGGGGGGVGKNTGSTCVGGTGDPGAVIVYY